ncbi:hypothetical protein FEM03_15870 [Phragmitibacter flavus]|uniref:Uncharacterized protein n=1 Tax=Phragmitibacter flavus TaxID=2576071 RepID=A0A5R8KBV6_9BACT|nr:hypothetical protein [Phragmitibacter flavus]TLD69800.1 hypothetical protein FEM03_15870 [Phragmitibacter flavus]
MNFAAYFNFSEAALWIAISAVLFWRWFRSPKNQRPFSLSLPLAFFAFGISDLIEIRSGAWWTPWWLLLLKTLCVIVFLHQALQHQRRQKRKP